MLGFSVVCFEFWLLDLFGKVTYMLDYFIVNSKCLPLSRFFSVCTIS